MENFKKVEAYFNNEFSDTEKADFLNEVETNTELNTEFNFQKDVINGIKEARKAELKAMLNQVPISAVSTASTGLYKVILGGAATILLGTAFWYYANSEQSTTQVEETVAVISSESEKGSDIKIEKKNPVTSSAVDPKETKEPTLAHTKATSTQAITPNLPSSEDVMDSGDISEEKVDVPEAISNSPINLNSKINVEVKLKKKYSFHYQYSNKGIVLYGDFKEGLFEILELNKNESTDYYLFYKSNYYYINEKSGEITALKPVTNKSLKNKLSALR